MYSLAPETYSESIKNKRIKLLQGYVYQLMFLFCLDFNYVLKSPSLPDLAQRLRELLVVLAPTDGFQLTDQFCMVRIQSMIFSFRK